MSQNADYDRGRRRGGGELGAVGLGVATGLASGLSLLLARKLGPLMDAGHGHPLKHRVLDAACTVLQRKYPVEAMSTYLNGFHFYADDMGRQVEATHFCIHLGTISTNALSSMATGPTPD